MQVLISLTLPRERDTVARARHIVGRALEEARVANGSIGDVLTALSEACTNVVDHACVGDDYRVDFRLGGGWCEIEVHDHGPGFEPTGDLEMADPLSSRGRGLALMRLLVDELHFDRVRQGTKVRLRKRIVLEGEPSSGAGPAAAVG